MATGKRKTTAEFVIEAANRHNNFYDYSLVNYTNKKTKVQIICPEHGEFEQQPDNHLMGAGCPKCYFNRKLKTLKNFINEANNIHQYKYDYSLAEYINNQNKIIIICPEHGKYEKTPNSHLCGQGCPQCSLEIQISIRTKSHNKFVEDAGLIHNDLYEYLGEYTKSYEKIEIKCVKCNHIFNQTPRAHLEGKGCPICKNSIGESKIRQFLLEHHIDFKPEYSFNDCRNIHPLPFDFYIEQFNICIEYDGIQHYKPIEFFGGEKAFKETQKRDAIKTKYCDNKNIQLIRIKYNEDITEKLKTMLLS
jgi:very-short-patch-repair endonuclease/Zn finger protein HypA/HybF involved in hydrogenase expression